MTNERDRNRNKGGDQTQWGSNEGSSNPDDQQLQREQKRQGGNRQQGSESERGRNQGGQGGEGQQQGQGGNRQQQGGSNVGRESERSREDEIGQAGRAEGRERDRKDR